MSKKPTPKKRLDSMRGRIRRSAYADNARKRILAEDATLETCTNCGAKHRRHYACEACGFYRGTKRIAVASGPKPLQEIQA